MNAKSAAQVKAFGKTIKGLDIKMWNEDASRIMKDLIKQSFRANPDALTKLLATGNATLTHTQDKGKWGTEFPKLLMEVRDELRPNRTENTALDEAEETPFELNETNMTNVFTYNDQLGNKEFYKGLVENNADVVFIRNNVNATYKDPKKNFGGQQEIDKFADNMTMNITTSLTKTNDNFANLPKTAYKDVLRLWEEEIAHIQGINDGKTKLTKIAFPTTGFGDPALMPQELFVYLSRRLFDEFGYVNPGSVMYNEMEGINTVAC